MNKRTRSIPFLFLFALALCAYGLPAELQNTRDMKSASYTRGKYLVEQVTLCAECHTPVNERGELDRSRWLQGAIIDLQPVRQNTNWALEAPDIAGLPGW